MNNQFNQQPNGQEPGKQSAIISLCCGVGSLVLPWLFSGMSQDNGTLVLIIDVIAIVAAILGIVFAAKARKANMAVGMKAGGMATAGLVCGIIALVLDVLAIACVACVICAVAGVAGAAGVL
ncbi:MAG: hypothetical protein II711_01745 [Clostridia bacterium]|nr:hypothetical protein [Clostridia bacterium]